MQLMKSRTRRTKQTLLRAAISSLYGKLSGCQGKKDGRMEFAAKK